MNTFRIKTVLKNTAKGLHRYLNLSLISKTFTVSIFLNCKEFTIYLTVGETDPNAKPDERERNGYATIRVQGAI